MGLGVEVIQEQEDSVDSPLLICYLFVWMVWVDHINHHHYSQYLNPVNLDQVFKVDEDLVDFDQEIEDRYLLLDSYPFGR